MAIGQKATKLQQGNQELETIDLSLYKEVGQLEDESLTPMETIDLSQFQLA